MDVIVVDPAQFETCVRQNITDKRKGATVIRTPDKKQRVLLIDGRILGSHGIDAVEFDTTIGLDDRESRSKQDDSWRFNFYSVKKKSVEVPFLPPPEAPLHDMRGKHGASTRRLPSRHASN